MPSGADTRTDATERFRPSIPPVGAKRSEALIIIIGVGSQVSGQAGDAKIFRVETVADNFPRRFPPAGNLQRSPRLNDRHTVFAVGVGFAVVELPDPISEKPFT